MTSSIMITIYIKNTYFFIYGDINLKQIKLHFKPSILALDSIKKIEKYLANLAMKIVHI